MSNQITYTEADLPSTDEILARIQRVDRLDEGQLQDEIDFAFETARKFNSVVQEYVDSQDEYYEDPGVVADTLERYHKYSGAILGHAKAVHRKAQHQVYESMTEGNFGAGTATSKAKYNQGDRERYAKGRTASMEGLVTMIEENHDTLGGRVFRQRQTASRSPSRYSD